MKKVDMTVTRRDKNLLIILIALVLGYLCYYFVIGPELSTRSQLEATIISTKTELSRAEDLITRKTLIEEEESNKKQELSEKYEVFLYDLNQERILYKLDTFIQQSGLIVVSYVSSDVSVSTIKTPKSQFTYSKYPLLNYAAVTNTSLLDSIIDKGQATVNKINTTDESKVTEQSIPTFDITINFTSSGYQNIMDFISKVEGMNKSIVIKKIDIHQAEINLSGQIVISVYSMPKVDESESSYLEFLPSSVTGKVNPFQ